MSKYGELIEKVRKPESQKSGKPEQDRDVNLSIKVLKSRRRHWAAEAKRQGVTLTKVIIEVLSKRFGEPES